MSREPVEELTKEEKTKMKEVEIFLNKLTRIELTSLASIAIVKKSILNYKELIAAIIKGREDE
jgi:hypothetical protein